MQISSRFTIALHIFACVETFKNEHKVTSDFLAGSINTNPVIIRRILTQLKSAGLITVARGTGGIEPTKPLEEISFYDVYQAIAMKRLTPIVRWAGTSTRCWMISCRRFRPRWKTR